MWRYFDLLQVCFPNLIFYWRCLLIFSSSQFLTCSTHLSILLPWITQPLFFQLAPNTQMIYFFKVVILLVSLWFIKVTWWLSSIYCLKRYHLWSLTSEFWPLSSEFWGVSYDFRSILNIKFLIFLILLFWEFLNISNLLCCL